MIHYDDGSTFDGDPFDAPRTGVVAITRPDAWVGWVIVHGGDYYCHEPERDGWYCTDMIGMADYLTRCRNPLVLFGRMVSTAQYRALLDRLRHELGPKSGRQPEEVNRGA